jgi:hypothetical protein
MTGTTTTRNTRLSSPRVPSEIVELKPSRGLIEDVVPREMGSTGRQRFLHLLRTRDKILQMQFDDRQEQHRIETVWMLIVTLKRYGLASRWRLPIRAILTQRQQSH